MAVSDIVVPRTETNTSLNDRFEKTLQNFSIDPNKSIQNWTVNIAYNPKTHYTAYNNRALMYLAQNNFEQSRKDLDKAIAINRRNAASKDEKLYINKGVLLARQGLFRQALIEFNTAIGMNIHSWQAYCCRANCLLQMGKLGEALQDYQISQMITSRYESGGFVKLDKSSIESLQHALQQKIGLKEFERAEL